MMFQDVVIVIPAYEPDDRLLELLKNIRDKENQMFDIILVDDGSGADFAPLFAIAQICKDMMIIKEKVVL